MEIINMLKRKGKGKFRAWFQVDYGTHVVRDYRLYESESGYWAAAPRYNCINLAGQKEQARPVFVDPDHLTLISRMAGDLYQGVE